MAEAILEKQACTKCGADVREGTSFCYACGAEVAAEEEAAAAAAHADADFPVIADEPEAEPEPETPVELAKVKLATAADVRRQSRRDKRKPKKIVWEEPGERSNRAFVLFTVLIFAVAALVVTFTVLIK